MTQKYADFYQKMKNLLQNSPADNMSKEAIKQLMIDCGLPIQDQSELMH
jgi:hypothetical protein